MNPESEIFDILLGKLLKDPECQASWHYARQCEVCLPRCKYYSGGYYYARRGYDTHAQRDNKSCRHPKHPNNVKLVDAVLEDL